MHVSGSAIYIYLFFLSFFRSNSDGESSLEEQKSSAVAALKKLMERLTDEQVSLKSENKVNEELGRQVTIRVMQTASPNECDKYKLHVEETDKITSLLLGLTGRIARTENLLEMADTEPALEKVRGIKSFAIVVVRVF